MIVVAGESLIDLVVHPGGRLVPLPGGGPYNVARTIARLGGRCSFLGRMSSDGFGQLLSSRLTGDGVDLSLAVTTDAPTTLAVAELDRSGAATYQFYLEGTAAPGLLPSDLPAELPADLTAIHIGTLGLVAEPIASTLDAFVTGLPSSVLLMVDPNCRPSATREPERYRARMFRLLARADLVKVSVDDLAFLLPGAAAESAAQQMLALGPQVVLVTDGAGPVSVVAPDGVSLLPVPLVPIVDTVGAGDAFGGGFLAAWTADGYGRAELADRAARHAATAFAIRVAALTCQRAGADPPTRAELAAPPAIRSVTRR